MGTDASSRSSICRASVLLKQPAVEQDFVILKLLPDPRHCCCFHCWPETWAQINEYIAPDGPIPDEGDTVIHAQGGQYVLECHESGPEVVIYLLAATASLQLVKSVVDLLTTLLKARQHEHRNASSRIKLTRRRVLDGQVEDEILAEIDFPLADDVTKMLNAKIRKALGHNAEGDAPTDADKPRR